MKILFSPSEAKSDFSDSLALNQDSLCFKNKFQKRVEVLTLYNDFIESTSIQNLTKLFGIKDESECYRLKQINILKSSTCKAIQRYSGVAYQYLDFQTLNKDYQNWLCSNTLIFSNLFGPVLAGDMLPYYRMKQTSNIDGFKPEQFYKKEFSQEIDNYIGSNLVIDLRAGFYEKFYTLTCKHITMKFKKNGKVVSHWAKAYRGKVLRELAKYQPNSIEEFENINFDGLAIEEIIEKKLKREYIFKINV